MTRNEMKYTLQSRLCVYAGIITSGLFAVVSRINIFQNASGNVLKKALASSVS